MRYLYYCKTCDKNYEREETMAEHGKSAILCGECADLLVSVITGGSGFILEGVSWGKDGYTNHGCACDKKDGGGPRGNGIITKD